MKRFVRYSALITVALACGATARAQTPGTASTDRGYAEVAAAATLGHKSASSFGGEAGYRLLEVNSSLIDELHIFIEAGRMGNVASADTDARALIIGNAIGASVSTVQVAKYFDAGVKVRLTRLGYGMWRSYLLLGVGAATVDTSASFAIAGTDVTGKLGQYGVQLGNDLSSSLTKTFLTFGVGTNANIGKRLLVDVGYRYGRILPKTDMIENDQAINTNRVQVGVGIRF